MGERNITLLAVHLHNNGDVQFGPKRISTGGRKETSARDRLSRGKEALPIPLAAGAIVLIAFAALAWRSRTGR